MKAKNVAPSCVAAVFVAAVALPQEPPTAELYRAKCQQCHMADGNSPLEPMNFADGTWTHGSKTAEVAKVISDGVGGTAMLPFKAQLSPEQVTALAAYVRAFDKTLKPEKAKKQ
jgi:mono/diheme cytochrome c family protein